MGAKLANLLLLLAAMSFNLFVVIAVVVVCGAAKLLSRYLNKGDSKARRTLDGGQLLHQPKTDDFSLDSLS